MKLISFVRDGQASFGCITDEGVVDLGRMMAGQAQDIRQLLARGLVPAAKKLVDNATSRVPLGGLVAAPAGLFLAEASRLKNRDEAWNSTKAYMIGWGWAFGVRFMIGLVITGLWMLWAWF